MRRAVVRGAAVAVLVVVGLLVMSDGGVPLIPGRPPTTSDPEPGRPAGGPTVDASALSVRLLHLDLEAVDLSARVDPEGSTPGAEVRAPVEFAGRNPRAYLDAEFDSLDGIAEFDRDGGEVRSRLDGSTRGTEGALASVLLALMVLKAGYDQGRDRRLRAAAPALAA